MSSSNAKIRRRPTINSRGFELPSSCEERSSSSYDAAAAASAPMILAGFSCCRGRTLFFVSLIALVGLNIVMCYYWFPEQPEKTFHLPTQTKFDQVLPDAIRSHMKSDAISVVFAVVNQSALHLMHFEVTSLCTRFEMDRVQEIVVVTRENIRDRVEKSVQQSMSMRCKAKTQLRIATMEEAIPKLTNLNARIQKLMSTFVEPDPERMKSLAHLVAATVVNTDFYLVLEVGNVVLRHLQLDELFEDGKALTVMQSIQPTREMWEEAAIITGSGVVLDDGIGMASSPFMLNRMCVVAMLEHLAEVSGSGNQHVLSYLLEHGGHHWTEESLYNSFLRRYGVFGLAHATKAGAGPARIQLSTWTQFEEFFAIPWKTFDREDGDQRGHMYDLMDEPSSPAFVNIDTSAVYKHGNLKIEAAEKIAFVVLEMV